ncbi:TENA/THI-4/PQQC family protein [Saccharothrix saharensis]|uniref:TENA/THI-4/PQQC family protein n=1 Tax=Saccharothrix saharensis TaxID=571190 RepID=A0A543J4V3_9PSEU|nr:transcriptional regulator [Saccharothrix saharensis]TQM77864.1 TENA/THI-4/PQQC family protein [Saccharothrix saharensis]
MAKDAKGLLERVRAELKRDGGSNRLVPLIASGEASSAALRALAAEEHRIVHSDWRAFLTLAAQSPVPAQREFFAMVAGGEGLALAKLADFASACGLTPDDVAAYRPLPGCQAYPSYVARLALDGNPHDALLAILANFAEWGGYCATIAAALREHYGFDDAGCAFFDFFAEPAPELDALGLRALTDVLATGWTPDGALPAAHLLHSYELMFWNTLADLP